MDYIESTGVQMEAEGAAAEVSTAPATGEQSADAALKHLMEDMKVPRDKAERYLKAKSRQAAAKPIAQTTASQTTRTETQPTEAPTKPETKEAAPTATAEGTVETSAPRLSFDELIRDGEYKQAFQSRTEEIVKGRVAKLSGYKDAMEKVKPMLLDMASMLGLDTSEPDKLDYEAIAKAYRNDPENYRKAATDMGTDTEAARSAVQNQTDTEQLRRRVNELEQERMQSVQQEIQHKILGQHMSRLRAQESELQKSVPDFSLDRELNDPVTGKKFRDLTMPGVGWSVQDAYKLIHWDELQRASKEAAARQAMEVVAGSIAAGQQRPRENNPNAGGGSSQHVLFSKKSKAEQEEIIKRVKRGEKVYL